MDLEEEFRVKKEPRNVEVELPIPTAAQEIISPAPFDLYFHDIVSEAHAEEPADVAFQRNVGVQEQAFKPGQADVEDVEARLY